MTSSPLPPICHKQQEGRVPPHGALPCPRNARLLLWGGTRSAYPLGRPGGTAKQGLTSARAARPKGRGGDSQEAGGTMRFPLLLCARRPRRPHSRREARAHTLPPSAETPQSGAQCAPLRVTSSKQHASRKQKRGEPHRFPLLLCARRPRRPHFPVKRGHIRCPFSRNAPIGRAMRALRDASSKQHASRKQKKRRTPSGSPLFYLPIAYSM